MRQFDKTFLRLMLQSCYNMYSARIYLDLRLVAPNLGALLFSFLLFESLYQLAPQKRADTQAKKRSGSLVQ